MLPSRGPCLLLMVRVDKNPVCRLTVGQSANTLRLFPSNGRLRSDGKQR